MSARKSEWKWSCLVLLTVIGGAQIEMISAAELKRETLKAWSDYVHATECRIGRELAQGDRFLVLDFQDPKAAAGERGAMLSGGIPAAKIESRGSNGVKIGIPDGMIHHWRGGIFIPDVDLNLVLARVENRKMC